MNRRGRLKQNVAKSSGSVYPVYNNRRKQWEAWLPCWKLMSYGDLEQVLLDVVEPDAGFYYPYHDNQPCVDYFEPHTHSISWLLAALVRDPENFSIDGFEEYYSKQEQEFIIAAKKKLITIKNNHCSGREIERKRNFGKCWLCGHELVERNIPHYNEDRNNRIIIVKNVPTTICSFCGDKACLMEVNEKLEQREREASNIAEINKWGTFIEIEYATGEVNGSVPKYKRTIKKYS